MCQGSRGCLGDRVGSCRDVSRDMLVILSGWNILFESDVRGQRKCLFPPDQSSVATASFCARYMGIDAMCHGLRGCFGGQVGCCGGCCCDVGTPFSPISHLWCLFHASGGGQISIVGHLCRVPASEPNGMNIDAMWQGSRGCLGDRVGSCRDVSRDMLVILSGWNILFESDVRGQRKCLFPPDQSSVATASFCARYVDMNAMCHGSHGCFGGQIGPCGGIIQWNVCDLSARNFVSAKGSCRRKWIFPACQSSVVWYGFCA